ncbi:hypothetical protein RHGRI_010134 [Rhododendron griersonianum]|uniref:E2 ubiquitin-conjugating enzyme n=1 Tax=Rhododendron griersonianum TaxID=479676 RepID=A0AAV6KHY2_9ERIC|nr:hypothetical protein RHGRI_010134 [Rhododendron griersonianum]
MAASDVEIGEFASEGSQKMLNHNEVAMSKDFGKSVIVVGSTSESLNSDHLNGPNSDLSCHSDDDANKAVDFDEDGADYDSDDYMYDDDDDDENDYLSMQAQFDDVDLPPGVEASFSWLKDPAPGVNTQAGPSSLNIYDPTNGENHAAATSSSTVLTWAGATVKEQEEKEQEGKEDQVLRNFQNFKRFDTVDDFADHHFNSGFSGQQVSPTKTWAKKIQEEWKILENNLPDTIYVRVYETRMDLLRAIIVGPAGTPYHDGLFVFDILFPPAYPDVPPMVYYYSGGLRINPNLYDCGKVCLSLLNTWTGKGNEKWIPKQSTMLQVLVSIQALILNAHPYFNEPGYAKSKDSATGRTKSKEYNENVFILSLKTMIYTLRKPPKYFEDFVAGHFHLRAHDILSACKAYMEGAEIGSVAKGNVLTEAGTSHRSEFKEAVARMMNGLVNHFVRNGSKDCEQFRLPC